MESSTGLFCKAGLSLRSKIVFVVPSWRPLHLWILRVFTCILGIFLENWKGEVCTGVNFHNFLLLSPKGLGMGILDLVTFVLHCWDTHMSYWWVHFHGKNYKLWEMTSVTVGPCTRSFSLMWKNLESDRHPESKCCFYHLLIFFTLESYAASLNLALAFIF